MGCIIFLSSQMRKTRSREVMLLARGHIASQVQTWDFNSPRVSPAPKPVISVGAAHTYTLHLWWLSWLCVIPSWDPGIVYSDVFWIVLQFLLYKEMPRCIVLLVPPFQSQARPVWFTCYLWAPPSPTASAPKVWVYTLSKLLDWNESERIFLFLLSHSVGKALSRGSR